MSLPVLPIIGCLVLCLGGWITICVAGPCDHGWYYRNGTCYKFHREKKTWIDANDTCTAQSARLVQIKYPELNTYLAVTAATIFTDWYWIGLKRTPYYEYRNFNENNATTLNWRQGEPNDGISACVYSQGGLMIDHSCLSSQVPTGFICQVSKACSDSTINMDGFTQDTLYQYGSHTCLMHKRFITQNDSWDHCHSSCSLRPGHLVYMTPEIDKFLKVHIKDYLSISFWIAARPFKENTFYWMDGTLNDMVLWEVGEPNIISEDCVLVLNGNWHDAMCSMAINFICEKEANPYEPPVSTTVSSTQNQFDCTCRCARLGKNLIVNMTMEQLQQAINELKSELAVNKSSLSSVIRRKISAGDKRHSAAIVGYIGTAILCVIFGFVIIADLPVLLRALQHFARSIRPAWCKPKTYP